MLAEVATLVVDGGHDLETALQRAARAQGVNLRHMRLPLESMRAAIRDYRELFNPRQAQLLLEKRRLALQAMQTFAEFEPRLIGALVHGDGPLDAIRLLLFADTPEQLMVYLNDRHIPWQDTEIVLNYSGGRRIGRPALRFVAGGTAVELIVLDRASRSDPPRDAVTGGRLESLRADELGTLISESAA